MIAGAAFADAALSKVHCGVLCFVSVDENSDAGTAIGVPFNVVLLWLLPGYFTASWCLLLLGVWLIHGCLFLGV